MINGMRMFTVLMMLSAGAISCGGSSDAAKTDAGVAKTDTAASGDGASSGSDGAVVTTDAATSTADGAAVKTDVASSTSDGAASMCNTLDNVGEVITPTVVATATPTGTGGSIAQGTYKLTNITVYMGGLVSPTATLKQTINVNGMTGQLVSAEGSNTYHKTFTVNPVGNDPVLVQTCSSRVGDIPIPYKSYTATSTSLIFYSTAAGFSVTYTK
jgi:hypothetical protein